jgi:hypothetical protein
MVSNESFPSQKKSEKEKNEKWARECVRLATDMGLYSDSFYTEYREVRTNMDLYNNILDVDDMLDMCDPFGINNDDFPFKPQHYPIANTKINLLMGEETKRRFDWKLKVINPDAVTEKEKEIMDIIRQELTKAISSDLPPEMMQRKLDDLKNYLAFDYQDARERRGTHLLNHMIEKENLKYKWNMGFLDGLVAGREIYSFDIVGGDPRVRKCNPANVRVIRKGYSADVQDADIIVEWGYHSRGSVIDMFHEYLRPEEVTEIERMTISLNSSNDEAVAVEKQPDLLAGSFSMVQDANGNMVPSYAYPAENMLSPIKEDGSVLVTRVVWRSYRKIGKLKYYDRNTGEQLYRFVDEFYVPNVKRGEEIEKYIWVTDWWEGTRIARNIYVKMRPWPVKAYSMTNPTGTMCPYVGGDYTMEGEPTTSLMGRLKPYSYYYDFMMYKLWETISKHKGVIGYLDLAMIPEGMEMEDALYFADRMGWLPIDSFKESRKGSSTGSIAGNMNTNRSPMNFDLGSYMQQNLYILNFLKEEIANISGVTRQREGSISSSELVGNTQRAVMQSSHVTEMYFHFHDRIKLATLKATLEVAKHAYRGRKLHVQYVSDDMSQVMSETDGDSFREIDFGLTINTNMEYQQLYQTMIQLAQAGLQNDKVNFSQIMDILSDPSISSVRRKIENAERQKLDQLKQDAQSQQESVQQIQQMRNEAAQQAEQFKAELALQLEKIRTDGKIDLEKAKMEFELRLKGTPSADNVLSEQNEVRKLDMQLKHEAKEGELDRRTKEAIEDRKEAKKSIK